MSVGISRLSNATEKFSSFAGKISAAKSVMLNKTETEKVPFKFSRPVLKDVKRRDEISGLSGSTILKPYTTPAAKPALAHGKQDEPILFEIETEARTDFLNTHIKEKIMARWELMGEEGPVDDFADEMSMQDLNEAVQETMPLMLGYSATTDYVELEYMVIPDPQNGECVTPVVTVEPTEDGKAGNISLNGKLVACVAGAQSLQAADVKLVQAEV